MFPLNLLRRKKRKVQTLFEGDRELREGERFAVLASVHGAFEHLQYMLGVLERDGCRKIFVAGDLIGECGGLLDCLTLIRDRDLYAVLGNHDIIVVAEDVVHSYTDEFLAVGAGLRTAINNRPDLVSYLAELPVIIKTPYFCVTHESVEEPYYARMSKRRKKYYSWSHSTAADENMYAVCYNRIRKPFFVGSDHTAYVLCKDKVSGIREEKIAPGTTVDVSGSAVISVPSVILSRDPRYRSGCVMGTVLPGGALRLTFVDVAIPPEVIAREAERSRRWDLPESFIQPIIDQASREGKR